MDTAQPPLNEPETSADLYADRWTTQRIECDTQVTSVALGIFSLIWTSIWGAVLAGHVGDKGWELSAGLIGIGIAAGLGFFLLTVSVYMYLRWRKFGTTVFELPLGRGEVGGSLKGQLRTSAAVSSSGEYTITLQCRESITTGTGKNRTTRTNTLWEGTQKLRAAGYSSRAGIPIDIAIPANCLETNDDSSAGTVQWELSVHAPVEGIDFGAGFTVPIYKKRM